MTAAVLQKEAKSSHLRVVQPKLPTIEFTLEEWLEMDRADAELIDRHQKFLMGGDRECDRN